MIRDATTGGLLSEQPFVARFETVSADFLDDSERRTAHLYLQKAVQTADDAWQQIVQGHNGPAIANPTTAEVEQTDLPRKVMTTETKSLMSAGRGRLNAPQLQAQQTVSAI